MILIEPDVALTDYFLAIECFLFAFLLRGQQTTLFPQRTWISVCFFALGLASLFGGTVHGFFVDEGSIGYRIFWPLTMISIGFTACSALMVGLHLYQVNERRLFHLLIWFLF